MPQQFDGLKERLLRAGVAPRRVHRYVGELRDHFEDLVDERIAAGVGRAQAELEARERIGSDEELASFMLERPGIRSFTARFPLAVFGLGPLVALSIVLFLATLLEGGFLTLQFALAQLWSGEDPVRPDWIKLLVEDWNWLVMHVAPLAIAGAFYAIGVRQRMAAHWIVLSLALVAFIGAFHDIGIRWSVLPGQTELSVGFGLYPPFAYDLERLFVNAALVASFYWIATRWRAAPAN